MKILLTLFVLFFSSSVFAEDISDFQIEGISVGESLLDYMSEEEIKKEADELAAKAKTESELIELEEEKIKEIVSMEEEEEDLK